MRALSLHFAHVIVGRRETMIDWIGIDRVMYIIPKKRICYGSEA